MAKATSKRNPDGMMVFEIDLDGPKIIVVTDQKGGGSIETTGLKDTDEPTEESWDGDPDDFDAEYQNWACCNAAIDGMESLILGAACAGVDISSAAFVEGIGAAYQAIGNNSY